MTGLEVQLFGQFGIRSSNGVSYDIHLGKVQELFCYLLLHRDQIHPREILLDVLWREHSPSRAKKALRQTLWQLKNDLNHYDELIMADGDHISINPDVGLWLDVSEFEAAYKYSEHQRGDKLAESTACDLQDAVELYNNGLLQGWYQDWYLGINERMKLKYIRILDLLIDYHAAHKRYRQAIAFGRRMLYQDPAHERTHYRLMQYYYAIGDRTTALRQYYDCKAALLSELDVSPAHVTTILYQQIRRDDQHQPAALADTLSDSARDELLKHLQQMKATISRLQILLESR